MASLTQQMRKELADRLRDALGPRSVWWLAEQLKVAAANDGTLRGATEGALRNYLNAKRSAPLELVRAMAEALGVNFAWLATGAGTRVRMSDEAWGRAVGGEVDQEAKRKRMASFSGQEVTTQLGRPSVSGDAPGEAAFVGDDPLLLALDQRHRLALLEMAREGLNIRKGTPTAADLRAAGKAISASLRVPAELTGTDHPAKALDDWHLARYIDAYLTAARLGVPRIQAGGKGKAGKKGKRKGT